MEHKRCIVCHELFSGTRRSLYCSDHCRRVRENRRRVWDQLNEYADALEKAANDPDTPSDRREFCRRKAEGLRLRLGSRP